MNPTDYLRVRTAAEAAQARRAAMRTVPPQLPGTVNPDNLSACYMQVEAGTQCGCEARYSVCRCGHG